MWNPFRRKKKKSQSVKELQDLATAFAILDKFEKSHLIYWQSRRKILVIEEALAIIELAQGRDGFMKFLNQSALWQNKRIIDQAYESHRLKIETEAVRKAQKQFVNLTKADIQRIRQNARDNMPIIHPEQLDCIKEFDIFIVRSGVSSVECAKTDSNQLLALGHFDGNEVEMSMYEDIKYILYDKPES